MNLYFQRAYVHFINPNEFEQGKIYSRLDVQAAGFSPDNLIERGYCTPTEQPVTGNLRRATAPRRRSPATATAAEVAAAIAAGGKAPVPDKEPLSVGVVPPVDPFSDEALRANTVAELKVKADGLGASYGSKATKDELIQAIMEKVNVTTTDSADTPA